PVVDLAGDRGAGFDDRVTLLGEYGQQQVAFEGPDIGRDRALQHAAIAELFDVEDLLAVLSECAKQRYKDMARAFVKLLATELAGFEAEFFAQWLRDLGDQRERHATGEDAGELVATSEEFFAREFLRTLGRV